MMKFKFPLPQSFESFERDPVIRGIENAVDRFKRAFKSIIMQSSGRSICQNFDILSDYEASDSQQMMSTSFLSLVNHCEDLHGSLTTPSRRSDTSVEH
jgi:hypothetical protein